MQPTLGLILLTAAASITSAWSFVGYSDFSYQGTVILNVQGDGLPGSGSTSPFDQPTYCANLLPMYDDLLSSFEWERKVDEFCKFTVFRDYHCIGPVLITSREASVELNMTPDTDKMASSVLIHCFDSSKLLMAS